MSHTCHSCMMEAFTNSPVTSPDPATVPITHQTRSQAPAANAYSCQTQSVSKCMYTTQGELSCGSETASSIQK